MRNVLKKNYSGSNKNLLSHNLKDIIHMIGSLMYNSYPAKSLFFSSRFYAPFIQCCTTNTSQLMEASTNDNAVPRQGNIGVDFQNHRIVGPSKSCIERLSISYCNKIASVVTQLDR